ncbi:acyltransferase [Paraflavitalea sp. CAU 1676]|uniref:acyltransferase family protein n=1 Tax=Paraflavitalea sp. CAU 1676 TaxID=3032598 RepID=UPI0023D9AB01|nr:acyltransferase [Paraflavitalea sp. CAU 1676]MDF2188577.1 acyltransferase [Paraflavitalea sp. CAU 1676]
MNPSYNSFRFFAFLAVFLFHINLVYAGYLGVQAFFVLSGFLITPILVDTKAETNGFGSYIRNFLVRRTLRIFPLYYFYLLILLITITVFGLTRFEYFSSLKSQLIYGFTYTYNIFHATTSYKHNEFITHFWSLAVEEQFYLLWPLLIFLTPVKKLKYVLQFIILLGPVIRFVSGYLVDHSTSTAITHDKDLFVYLSTLSHLDAFAIGGYFALYQTRVVRNLEVFFTFGMVLALGYVTNLLAAGSLQFLTFGFPAYMQNSYKYIWGYTALNYCFALMLFKLKSRNFHTWLFENRVLTSLGKVSYGLYVYHFGIIHLAHMAGEYWGIMDRPVLKLMVDGMALLATIGISYLSYNLFENRFIGLKDKLAPKHVPPGQSKHKGSEVPVVVPATQQS